jgi:hypothetical protein
VPDASPDHDRVEFPAAAGGSTRFGFGEAKQENTGRSQTRKHRAKPNKKTPGEAEQKDTVR